MLATSARDLLLCLWFGVDLRSKYHVDVYSTDRKRKTSATSIGKIQQDLGN